MLRKRREMNLHNKDAEGTSYLRYRDMRGQWTCVMDSGRDNEQKCGLLAHRYENATINPNTMYANLQL